MPHRIEEFMRGSLIHYQEDSQLKGKDYLKVFVAIVWGTTEDDGIDYLEIGKHGSEGYMPVAKAIGIDITEDLLLEYGFLNIKHFDNCSTYYRDDFGYLRLDVYGIEHVYMKGKPIKYLHNFQRIFFDYTGKPLHPKPSELPKQGPKLSYQIIKPVSAEEMLKNIDVLKNISLTGETKLDFDF